MLLFDGIIKYYVVLVVLKINIDNTDRQIELFSIYLYTHDKVYENGIKIFSKGIISDFQQQIELLIDSANVREHKLTALTDASILNMV